MPKVANLNPVRAFDIGGSDLFIPFRHNNRIGFVAGDSFSGNEPKVGGDGRWWRSPILLWSDANVDVRQPIRFTGAARGGGQILDYEHTDGKLTKLPADAISIDGRIYLWVFCTWGLGNESHSEIWVSDDDGESWQWDGHRFSAQDFGGRRVMLTWDRAPGSDLVDIFTTGGLARDKGILRWRVHKDHIRDPKAWQSWGWNGQDWDWGRPPSEVLTGRFGELGFRYLDGHAVLTGFDAADYCAVVRIGRDADADWTSVPTFRPISGHPFRAPDSLTRLYGCYPQPGSKLDGERFVLIVSEWQVDGAPYRGSQWICYGITPNDRPHRLAAPDPVPWPGILARLRAKLDSFGRRA